MVGRRRLPVGKRSIDFLLTDEPAAMALTVRASQRYEETFSNNAIEKVFLDVTAAARFEF